MRSNEYQKMYELENSYWWFIGRQKIVRKQLQVLHLDPRQTALLNIGSGTGGTVHMLEEYGRVTNIDTAEAAITFSAQQRIAVQKIEVDTPLPFPASSYDGALALDVLEHIEHDESSLRDWFRVLRPGGFLLMTVPAYQWLWSDHDEGLHHFRRYTLSGIHRKLNLAGFHVRKRSYAIMFSFPLVVGFRFLRSLGMQKKRISSHSHASESYVQLPRILNGFFISLLYLEAFLLPYINLPFGTSIVVIAEKPNA